MIRRFGTTGTRAIAISLYSLTVLLISLCWPTQSYWVFAALAFTFCALWTNAKGNYLHPAACFVSPWIMIIGFSFVPISTHHAELDQKTYILIFGAIFFWMLFSSCARTETYIPTAKNIPEIHANDGAFRNLFILCYAVFGGEIVASGYLPAISLIATGDSRYFDFGIHGLHGALLAYANALGCFAYYLQLRTGERKYWLFYASILAIFILTVTRQNVLTLLVETIVIRSLIRGPIKTLTLAVSFALFLGLFSLAGSLRSGNIADLIQVKPDYLWMPSSVLWLYAYSYFNVMNLQTMLFHSGAPFYDGSSLENLIPSFLRPDVETHSYLVISNMTVTSYLDPVYQDVGLTGIAVVTAIAACSTAYSFNKAVSNKDFVSVATYSCLYYCAFLSFFVNNWFYLPVIFQIVFFPLVARSVILSHPPK